MLCLPQLYHGELVDLQCSTGVVTPAYLKIYISKKAVSKEKTTASRI
jgi:hypothetical protein